MEKIVVKVDGMQCGMCEAHVNEAVRAAFPVKKVTSSHAKGETVILTEQDIDDAKLKERYEALGEEARATIYGKQVADELVKLEKVTVGAVAPNFSAPLADGGVLSLHETKAKVKVVDFWASWC